ncbi:MAG: AarF/ABC1/UbiB kinase family protein [Actinobacteria bacterium]|nr:MAG: AarF/ABC1/UbiB kinase family protein [Actinomycetota bacterium]
MVGFLAHPVAKTRRHLRRYGEIADVLAMHGFANVADQLGLPRPARRVLLGRRASGEMTLPERARVALQELGPTFIKFGQSLSTRPDMVPDEFVRELEKLQDELPPVPLEEILAVIEEELGRPADEVFEAFEAVPIAAASIGQVHRARLRGGREVVVKVRRPGIDLQIRVDTELLTDLASAAERRTTWGRRYGVSEVVEEFARSLEEQLDFVLEGRYADLFRLRLEPDSPVQIPLVHWDFTTSRVLTMDYVNGIKISHVAELEAAGHDLPRIARTLLDYVLRQALIEGLFHADPHPGNIAVREDGTLVFVDFGLVGFLDNRLRGWIGDMIIGFVVGDERVMAEALMNIGRVYDRSGQEELALEVGRLFRRYHNPSLSKPSVGEVMLGALRGVTKYGARVPGEGALFIKTLVSIEGLCLRLYPELDVPAVSKPVADLLLRERFDPARIYDMAKRNTQMAARLAAEFPERLQRLMNKAESGALRMTVDLGEVQRLQSRLDVIANRLIVGLLVSATLVASALMFRSGLGPAFFGIPILGALGFLTGFLIGARLLIAVIRSGNI